MKITTNYLIVLLVIAVACSCGDSNQQQASSIVSASKNLPDANHVPLDIPGGPGSAEFIANCQTCHTARYVLMQPKLSRKAWEKSVDKMIHVYGAAIDSLTAIKIVDYLAAR